MTGRLGLELLILCGAIAGFLVFNLRSPWLKRALVFLGDTGGLLLGLLLAWFSIRLAGAETAPLRPMTAVWILAVPLADMGVVMLRRMLQHKSPFHPDRQHLHYVYLDAGFSVSQVVFLMGAMSVACSVLALACEAHGVPEYVMFGAFIGLLLVYGKLLACPKIVAEAREESYPRGESSRGFRALSPCGLASRRRGCARRAVVAQRLRQGWAAGSFWQLT